MICAVKRGCCPGQAHEKSSQRGSVCLTLVLSVTHHLHVEIFISFGQSGEGEEGGQRISEDFMTPLFCSLLQILWPKAPFKCSLLNPTQKLGRCMPQPSGQAALCMGKLFWRCSWKKHKETMTCSETEELGGIGTAKGKQHFQVRLFRFYHGAPSQRLYFLLMGGVLKGLNPCLYPLPEPRKFLTDIFCSSDFCPQMTSSDDCPQVSSPTCPLVLSYINQKCYLPVY